MAPSVVSQADKAQTFRALHARDRAFIIPNPWDPGTARLLASLGFEALATTSAGYAFSQGVVDGAVDGPAMLAHVAAIVAATDLPVSADLENGFGDDPASVAATILAAAATVSPAARSRTSRAGQMAGFTRSPTRRIACAPRWTRRDPCLLPLS